MSGLKFAQALAGVSKGVINGLKLRDEQKASVLNNMLTQQSIEKNDMLLKNTMKEELKKQQVLEMDKLSQYANLTGDFSQFNAKLEEMQAPFRFSQRASGDKKGGAHTVDILDTTGAVLKQGVPVNEALNSMYFSVTGKEFAPHVAERELKNKLFTMTTETQLDIAKKKAEAETKGYQDRLTKQTAPAEAPSTAAVNTARAERTQAETDYIEAHGSLEGFRDKGDPDPDPDPDEKNESLMGIFTTK